MWPFGKHARSIDELGQMADTWSIMTGQIDDGPLIVRRNTGAEPWSGCPELSIKLGFAIPLRNPMPGGLPEADENRQLAAIEDHIYNRVMAATRGVHVLTLTNGVMKEFVFYIEDGSVIPALHQQLRSEIGTHEVQCMAVTEKTWETYHAFGPSPE